jgi:GR25 family glycosyltransferase involved in LPS biosynthesis
MALLNIRNCPVYVINLDRRPDRWATFSQQPTLAEFPKLQRFSAVDGSKLNVLEDDRISTHTRMNILKKIRRSHYEINTPGACGASFSHIGIWQKFLESEEPYVIVFEDDTCVTPEDLAKIDTLVSLLPKDGWDMWLLGRHKWAFNGKPLTANTKSWWTVKDFTGAHAYILSRRGAEILCQQPFPIETHIEYYITGCSALKSLRIIQHPALRMSYFAEQADEMDSDTFDSRKSCPVCYIPDDFTDHGFYMTYWKFNRVMAGLLAVGIVGAGLAVAKRRS